MPALRDFKSAYGFGPAYIMRAPRFVDMVNEIFPTSSPELQLDAGDLNILHNPAYTKLWNEASRLSTWRSAMRAREERRAQNHRVRSSLGSAHFRARKAGPVREQCLQHFRHQQKRPSGGLAKESTMRGRVGEELPASSEMSETVWTEEVSINDLD